MMTESEGGMMDRYRIYRNGVVRGRRGGGERMEV